MQKKNKRGQTAFYLLLIAVGLVSVYLSFGRGGSGLGDEYVASLGNQHVNEKEEHQAYNSTPPTSGPHLGSSVAPWGVHTEQIPDELQVHNLEDGGVIIHYDPARVDNETLKSLTDFGEGRGDRHLVVEPYVNPTLPSPIVLTAWTRLLRLEQFDREAIISFIKKYEGRDHHVRKPL